MALVDVEAKDADAAVEAAWATYGAPAEHRRLVTLPADAADAAKLAPRYASDELGEIAVRREGPALVFDFGEWKSEVASHRNPDGSVSFRAVDAGIWGFGPEFVVDGAKRTRSNRRNDGLKLGNAVGSPRGRAGGAFHACDSVS